MLKLKRIKAFIKLRCPTCFQVYCAIRQWRFNYMESIFSEIYHALLKEGAETVSGPGSTLLQTGVIRAELPILMDEINAESLLDVPCGDLHWMKHTKLNIKRYIGVDIVPELIEQNKQKFGNDTRKFFKLDISKDDLPQMDIILCRDLLPRLTFRDIFRVIRNFKKTESQYLLTTTHTEVKTNWNIITGSWRPINLQLPPFNFPRPIKLINERNTEEDGKYSSKSLALWRLEDITI